jgi:hypothetical protein
MKYRTGSEDGLAIAQFTGQPLPGKVIEWIGRNEQYHRLSAVATGNGGWDQGR